MNTYPSYLKSKPFCFKREKTTRPAKKRDGIRKLLLYKNAIILPYSFLVHINDITAWL